MINKILYAFLCSFFAAIVIGMMINRVLPTWEELATDVGDKGVWLVSLYVHFIYGLAIGFGAILDRILYKNGPDTYFFWFVTSGVIVILLHLYLLFVTYESNFSMFFLLLLIISFVSFLVASILWSRFSSNNST